MNTEVEIATTNENAPQKAIEEIILKLLESKKLRKNSIVNIPSIKIPDLNEFKGSVEAITINNVTEPFNRNHVTFYYYSFSEHERPENEILESHENEGTVTAFMHWMLPNKTELHGLYESLIYDDHFKENLLEFAKTIVLFSKKSIDQNIVSCNRLILLHGTPGKYTFKMTNRS
jgi:hypothetical protein